MILRPLSVCEIVNELQLHYTIAFESIRMRMTALHNYFRANCGMFHSAAASVRYMPAKARSGKTGKVPILQGKVP